MIYNFKKNDTLKIKGIAIIMLICFHCFSSINRLSGYHIIFFPLSQNLAINISEYMFNCVGIFTFLSAYGITMSFKNINDQFEIDIKEIIKLSLNRSIKLLLNFFVIYIICFFISYIFFKDTINYRNIYDMIIDFMGLGQLFDVPKLCGTWWYMSFAICLIFFMPILLKIMINYNIKCNTN